MKWKFKNLKTISKDKVIKPGNEIKEAEEKIQELKEKTYNNLTAWDRVNIARNQSRPTSLDYIKYIFDDFRLFEI